MQEIYPLGCQSLLQSPSISLLSWSHRVRQCWTPAGSKERGKLSGFSSFLLIYPAWGFSLMVSTWLTWELPKGVVEHSYRSVWVGHESVSLCTTSGPSPPALFSGCHEVGSFAQLNLSAVIFLPWRKPKLYWTPRNLELNWTSLPLCMGLAIVSQGGKKWLIQPA